MTDWNPHGEQMADASMVRTLAAQTRDPAGRSAAPDFRGLRHAALPARRAGSAFRHETSALFGEATGTDLFVGRNAYSIRATLGLTDISVDHVVVDALRVPRESFAAIFSAWRDGHVEPISALTRFSSAEAKACFDQMIADIRDPNRYAVWMVPVVAAKVPLR